MQKRKLLLIGTPAAILLFASCMTTEKATGYLANHRKDASEFCAAQFPEEKRTSVTVIEDTATSNEQARSLNSYKDSVLRAAAGKNDSIVKMRERIKQLQNDGYYSQATADVLQAQLNGIKPVDTAALTRATEAKIKATIKPCKDSIVEHFTGITTAKYEAATLSRDEERKAKDDMTDSRNKWRKWFIILASFNVAYLLLRIFVSKLGFVGKFIK